MVLKRTGSHIYGFLTGALLHLSETNSGSLLVRRTDLAAKTMNYLSQIYLTVIEIRLCLMFDGRMILDRLCDDRIVRLDDGRFSVGRIRLSRR